MITEVLYIKNMVCPRCERVVKEELEKLGLEVKNVTLGEATVESTQTILRETVSKVLKTAGFELLEDKNVQVVEKIKTIIIEFVHHGKEKANENFSEIIAKEVGKDYYSLSKLFSEIESVSIERYIINQKIEKVKELLFYNEMSLSQIAWSMNYSSVAHLSSQFKQITGMTPSAFKKIKGGRKPLDEI